MDESGLFYEILLQELAFLGNKVFLGPKHKNSKIIVEVTKAIDFLERVAVRTVGEEVPMDFDGEYCCFAIRIVGKKPNMTPSGEVYVNHIKKKLMPRGIETLYILGTWDNRDVIENICMALEGAFEKYRVHKSKVTLTYKDDGEERNEQRRQYLVILRRKGATVFRQSA